MTINESRSSPPFATVGGTEIISRWMERYAGKLTHLPVKVTSVRLGARRGPLDPLIGFIPASSRSSARVLRNAREAAGRQANRKQRR